MIGFTNRKYKIKNGPDIEKYIAYYCGTYPDTEIINLLNQLSTKSLIKAYMYVKQMKHLSNYYRNLAHHLFILLEKRNSMINGSLIYDYEDDSQLQDVPC